MVQRSRELLNWSRCVSWLIATADQILQWTWKKKCHGSGALLIVLRKPHPSFTNSYGSSIYWRKQPDVAPPNSWWRSLQMQRNLLEAGDSVRLTSSERQDRIGNAIEESIRRFWWKIQAMADGKKENKIRTETWVKLSIKSEEINFNHSIIFLCPLFSGSELKYLSSIARTELTYPPFWLNCFWGSI